MGGVGGVGRGGRGGRGRPSFPSGQVIHNSALGQRAAELRYYINNREKSPIWQYRSKHV